MGQHLGQEVVKVYQAIVAGRVPEELATIKKPIEAKSAITRLQVLDSHREASHIRLRLDTGRTHQIRKHLAAMRHPVLGDHSYTNRAVRSEAMRNVPRQMLHASGVSFSHPNTNKVVRVKAPLPPDFKACLKALKLS